MTKTVLDNGEVLVILTLSEYKSLSDDIEMWGRREIAKFLGISYQRLCECPWLLPDNGGGKRRRRNVKWPKREVLRWHSKSREQLKKEYLNAISA